MENNNNFANNTEWLEKRHESIGASEVAALFDAHPFLTLCELWQLKKNNEPREYTRNDLDKIYWGSVLEDYIALGLARKYDWRIQKMGTRQTIKHPRIEKFSATLDWQIIIHPDYDTPGCFEIKTHSQQSFIDKYIMHDNHNYALQLPLSIEYQLQSQMAVSNLPWAACGVLVGGQNEFIFYRYRDESLISKIEEAVEHFWESITAGISLCNCDDVHHE